MEAIIFKGFLLGWLISNFEPLQELLSKIKNKISDKYFIVFYLKTSVSCHKCLSFWSTLIMSGNIWLAASASIIAFTFEQLINKLNR